MTWYPVQEVSSTDSGALRYVKAMKAPIPRKEHTLADRTQNTQTANSLTGVAGPEASVYYRMGTTFH